MKQLAWVFLFITSAGMTQEISITEAKRLLSLPMKCVQKEYPNKLGQVLNEEGDLKSPAELHPSFYGCFDWHSSVHGHWLMVKLLNKYPELITDSVLTVLQTNLSKDNIQKEIAYFGTKNNGSFERTYGWNWLLKLQLELENWNHPVGKELSSNLKPLSDLFCRKYIEFLPKLNYAIRSGDHINTAFGLTFAYDYAIAHSNDSLKTVIEKRARDFYFNDKSYPLHLEPSGYDFLSGGFEEIDIMRRILSKEEFKSWLKKFAPQLFSKKFTLEPGKVSDRSDGHLVHLDGLNFSRAWCLYGITKTLPELKHLNQIADQHIQTSLSNIVDGDYMGEHWLASFALLALLSK
jgi:DNA modification methylase